MALAGLEKFQFGIQSLLPKCHTAKNCAPLSGPGLYPLNFPNSTRTKNCTEVKNEFKLTRYESSVEDNNTNNIIPVTCQSDPVLILKYDP